MIEEGIDLDGYLLVDKDLKDYVFAKIKRMLCIDY